MVDSPEEAICRAVAEEIDSGAGLADHQTVLFTRPRIILPEDVPLLCVWVEEETEAAVETDRVSYWGTLGVSWHVESIEAVTELADDPDLQVALLRDMRAIKERMHYITYHGFTPDILAVEEFVPAGWRYFTSDYDDGLTQGYAGAFRFRMVDTPPDQ